MPFLRFQAFVRILFDRKHHFDIQYNSKSLSGTFVSNYFFMLLIEKTNLIRPALKYQLFSNNVDIER